MKRSTLLFALLTLCASGAQAQSASAQAPAAPVVAAEPAADPLIKTDTKVGTGTEAILGSTVVVHYTGWLFKPVAPKQHGRKFDSSLERNEPLDFTLGAGKVIKGWEQGVLGMKVGGKRTLIIPSALAYGPKGFPPVIPASADLIFDIELLNVK
jgi:FKBP-type peptidyl-prolyl cis-trans isomerase FkpA